MNKSLLSLVLLCSTACRTSEASSSATAQAQPSALNVAANPGQLLAENKIGDSKVPPAAVKGKGYTDVKAEGKSLLKWRIGRWSLVLENNESSEKMNRPGTVACDVTADLVLKHLGAEKLKSLEAAIAVVYKIKDQRQSSPIFRGLDQSRELVASYKGEEFMIEKMYQSRDSINAAPAAVVSRDIAKAGDGEAALDMIMEIALNPLICPKVPN